MISVSWLRPGGPSAPTAQPAQRGPQWHRLRLGDQQPHGCPQGADRRARHRARPAMGCQRRTVPYGYPLFHTHERPQLYSCWPARSSRSSTDPRTGRYVGWLQGWRDRSKLSRLPCDPLRARGAMTRGLGRIPRIRATLPDARDEAGNDIPAGRYTPAPGHTGHPAEGTGGMDTGECSRPGRRSPGLAPDVLGWPWHPRRLATARHRGHEVA
jgi:hypothetical protein